MTSRPTFVPLEAFHVQQIVKQPAQRIFKGPISETAIAGMVAGPAKACLVDGRCLAAGGLVDGGHGVAKAWALIGADLPKSCWPGIIDELRAGIAAALHPDTGFAHRVYAETTYDWAAGHKLLLHLGMSLEGMSRGGFPGGKHAVVYAQCRPDVPALPTRWKALLGVAARCLWEDTMNRPLPFSDRQGGR